MIKLYGVPASRAGRTLWMLAELGVEIDGLGTDMILNRTTLSGVGRDEQKALAAEERLRKPLGILNDALRGSDYLLGSEFSVADLNVAAVVFVLGTLGHMDLAPYPELTAWLARCLKRPARARAFS